MVETTFRCIESIPSCTAGDPRPPSTIAADTPVVLLQILQPSVGLAVWARTGDHDWHEAINLMANRPGLSATACCAPPMVADRLSRQMPDEVPAWLAEDITALAGFLATVGDATRVSVNLSTDVSRHDAPAPDGLRLLCRYGGPPLRWWDADSGDRPDGTVDVFAVALVKGARHPALRRRAIRLGDAAPTPARQAGFAPALTLSIELAY